MSEQPSGPRQEFAVEVPAEVEAGVPADFAAIWHTPDSFVLDFAALTKAPEQVTDGTGAPVMRIPARVVSRVRIPPGQVFELMRALEAQLSQWELERGARHRGGDAPPG